ncbi:metaxin 3 [Planoprotostelium fungivorum]|uniref:Metaxin 3 n=1 Tax=Planoprotostelium fungivorum TaxID=1890364 RepID=A0A2P6MQS6_9EUKA|nr:metaxin 3 [Planoprotostelium fungivorum]
MNLYTLYLAAPIDGLPLPLHPASIKVKMYAELSGFAAQTVEWDRDHNVSPTGKLPMLVAFMNNMLGEPLILPYLAAQSYDLDSTFSAEAKAEVCAFSFIDDKLDNIWRFHLWGNEVNSERNLYHSCAGKNLFVSAVRKIVTPPETQNMRYNLQTPEKVYGEASDLLHLLSDKLSDKLWFFGDIPSSFDTIVFGFLYCYLHADLPDASLSHMMQRHENLVRYVKRVEAQVFGTASPTPTFENKRLMYNDIERFPLFPKKEKKVKTLGQKQTNTLLSYGALGVIILLMARTAFTQKLVEQ